MENKISDNLELTKFTQIIVNVFDQSLSDFRIEGQSEQKSTELECKGTKGKADKKSPQIHQVYSIKAITVNKTELEIIDLIRYELGIVDNDVTVWNKMINPISKFSIYDNPPAKGLKN